MPTIGLVGGVLILAASLARMLSKKCKKEPKETDEPKAEKSPDTFIAKAEKIYLLAKVKLFSLFLASQVISEFATISSSTGGGSYPEPAATFVRALAVTNFDILGFVPLGCLIRNTNFFHQVVFKTIFPPVAVGLLWCYPLSNALRGKPNDAAIITVKRLTLLLLEVTLPGIATSLVQVYVTIECSE